MLPLTTVSFPGETCYSNSSYSCKEGDTIGTGQKLAGVGTGCRILKGRRKFNDPVKGLK